MLKNNYISHVQKGFKASTPGCLEHSFAMFEALLDAKSNQRKIVVSWLDLKNAYGSVRTNLIQFALTVPKLIRELIFDYYEKICPNANAILPLRHLSVSAPSCILFNCVFKWC